MEEERIASMEKERIAPIAPRRRRPKPTMATELARNGKFLSFNS
jgi:hypothetical protein